MLRLATLVGCNYKGTMSALHGCINDVRDMYKMLTQRFDFEARNITVLTDDSVDPTTRPTGAKIKSALHHMLEQARGLPRSGAHLFFHFSGHGTLVSEGPDDRQEAIVPCDFNLITDNDFRLLLHDLPHLTIFTAVMDTCRCGGPHCPHRREQIAPAAAAPPRIRCIPLATVMHHLGVSSTDPGQLKGHMLRLFDKEASALFRHEKVPAGRRPPDYVVLLTACQKYEHAAEKGNSGAFTSALLAALQDPDAQVITNSGIMTRASQLLKEWGYIQQPRFYIIATMLEAPFLCSKWPLKGHGA